MKTKAHAYCYRSGQIAIGRIVPDGALPIASGSESTLRRAMRATARHAYDGKTLLVPGLPEARNDTAALTALRGFIAWATKGRPGIAPPDHLAHLQRA